MYGTARGSELEPFFVYGIKIDAIKISACLFSEADAHFSYSVIDQIVQDDFFGSAADAVHPSHPFHLILSLQPLSDTFGFLHLRDQPIEHLLCCVADFLEMIVQLASQQHPRVDAVPVLTQILPALFCKSVVHILSPFTLAV